MSRFEHKGFTGTCEYSKEDELLVGRIEGIDSLILYSGASIDEMHVEFVNAVDSYLAHCEEIGVDPQKTYSGTFNVRVGSETHRQISNLARIKQASLNETVKKALCFYINCHRDDDISKRLSKQAHVLVTSESLEPVDWDEGIEQITGDSFVITTTGTNRRN